MKRYLEMDIAKGIGIILVILGHALDATQRSTNIPAATGLFDFIYSFHMPLFVLVAGFVSGPSLLKYSKRELIVKRTKRLMIPYFVAGILYFLMKMGIAKIKHFQYNEAKNLWKMFIGTNPSLSLWFLYVLFVLSIISILFVKEKRIIYITLIAIIISILFGTITLNNGDFIKMLERVCRHISYYFVGLLVFFYYENIKKQLYKWYLPLLSLCIFISIFALQNNINNVYLKNTTNILMALSASVIIINISNLITNKCKNTSKQLVSIGKYSMDIYIIGSLIQPMAKMAFGTGAGLKYWIYVFGSTILIIALSIVLSKYFIRKIKILRLLLLGLD